METAKRFDAKTVENRWKNAWIDKKIYAFDRKSKKKTFVIDTPPPYPSGEFHMGNLFNWVYIDVPARFKRMRGFNVLFPQGWDCHGLPTEVKVENEYKTKSSNVSRETWIKMCNEWTEKFISRMKTEMINLGFSTDWSTEYRTCDDNYMRTVQLSFLQLRESGLVYRGKHPVNWCPRCETAIADAEVEYDERRTKLNFIKFRLSGEGEIVVATTRPELLHACVAVAVNPNDERYKEIANRKAIVPIFRQEVEIFTSKDVDPDFGTGIVMICTFGDKQDVIWTMKHRLPIMESIDEKGKLKNAGRFSGLKAEEAKEKILEELKKTNVLLEQKNLDQNVGFCWRCKTPIEILNKEQWFVAVTKITNDIVKWTRKVQWIPDHMKIRMINWAQSMDWDWVISRQRVYGTPFPVWYCKKCGEIIFADEKDLPVDPTKKNVACTKCKSDAVAETDTMDTWMDSSITPLYHANWPKAGWEKLYPADVQPNGTDIIRTWDYYLMARCLALTKIAPYKTVLINGMVMGEDGKKMSKSLGNYVTVKDVIDKTSTDALRLWCVLGGATGSDVPFSWKTIDYSHKFLTKFWNIFRFSAPHLQDQKIKKPKELKIMDKWILSKANAVLTDVTKSLELYQLNKAIEILINFVWHDFADNYIEIVKHRLYNGRDASALWTLRRTLDIIVKMLAPFAPFITEEIHDLYFKKLDRIESIHLAGWPEFEKVRCDFDACESGIKIISRIRQHKSSLGVALNTPISLLAIDCGKKEQNEIKKVIDDIKGAMSVKEITFGKTEGEILEIDKIKITVVLEHVR